MSVKFKVLFWSQPPALLGRLEAVCVLVFPQPFLKWRGRVGGKRMVYWLAPLKAEAHSTLCRRRKQKRGEKESTLEWESEVTEFIRRVGSEPPTCLWLSVAVPVHVFSLLSGKAPFASEFMSKLSHCVGHLILIQVFCPLQILWLPSDLFSSFSGESLWSGQSSKRGFQGEWLISPSLCLAGLFLHFVEHICMLCQYHEFFLI